MESKKNLTLVTQPQAYFKELITAALEDKKLTTSPETEFYLVNLLYQFMTTDRLYRTGLDGEKKDEPLVVMIQQALAETEVHHQSALFRQVGDVSLYVAGYFQDSLSRKLVDVDYYIEMGGVAYQNVALRVDQEPLKLVYSELAQRFGSFVEILALVSDKTTPKTERDILRLYDLWVNTRSERAAKALQEAGILPNETIKKDWQ